MGEQQYLEEVAHGLVDLLLPVLRDGDEVVLSDLGELAQDVLPRLLLHQLVVELVLFHLALVLHVLVVLGVQLTHISTFIKISSG